MRVNLKQKCFFSLIMIIFVVGFTLISQAKGQEQIEDSQIVTQKTLVDGTRVVISTSGPAEFSSYWLGNPSRLVVEFHSGNIISQMDNEVILNQGVLKRITSSYSGEGEDKLLKSLTFEFAQKVPYKIWQEGDAILLDIQAPLETPVFHIGSEEIFTESETNNVIIKRLEAMDVALMQIVESEALLQIPEPPLESPEVKIAEKVVSPKTIALPAAEPPRRSGAMLAMVFSLAALALVSSLGFFVWRRHKLEADEKIKRLKLELQERNKRLEQEEINRRTMEQTSLEKEKEHQQLRDSFETLKGELIEKGMLKKELSPEEKERPWIPGKSEERRQYPRLPLSRDYNKTIILRIESPDRPESIKSFTSNISIDGLCFDAKEQFQEKEPVNLRLFFYGDIVPMMKIKAQLIWRKEIAPINCYGVYFDMVEEKDKVELYRYIESKIA